MLKCMGKGSMDLFLQTIDLASTQIESVYGTFLIIHADMGPVLYVWDGLKFCLGGTAI